MKYIILLTIALSATIAHGKLDPAFWVLPVHDDPIENDCRVLYDTAQTPDFDINIP